MASYFSPFTGEPAGKILIVDHDPSRRAAIQSQLAGWGYDTRSAYDGYSGMRQVLLERPDLIIVDDCLQGWSTSTVIEGAARLGSRAAVLVLGAREPDSSVRALRRRIAGVVDAEGSPRELLNMVTTALARNQLA